MLLLAMKLNRMMSALTGLALLAVITIHATAQPASSKGLRVFAVDVEGGQATLFVVPTGQSLLVDTGWAGNNYRDADRIVAAAKSAGLTRIDTVLLTHYHSDHTGGVVQLAERIPIGMFLDHGAYYESDTEPREFHAAYIKLLATGKYKHAVMHAGEKLPIAGFDAVAISSDGAVISKVPGNASGGNPYCAAAPDVKEDTTENGHSLGIAIRFAGMTIVDAGDLTADRERSLVCPQNKIGKVDLLIVSHHGIDLSSSKVFVQSLAPRVAIMDNGAHKGGSTSVIDNFRNAGVALYQLHEAPPAGVKNPAGTVQGGPEHNVPANSIANTGTMDGKRIDVVLNPDGTIDVTNQRTGQTQKHAGPIAEKMLDTRRLKLAPPPAPKP